MKKLSALEKASFSATAASVAIRDFVLDGV